MGLKKENWINKGYTKINNQVLHDNQLSGQAKSFYGLLLSYAFDKRYCYPSQETLANKMNVTPRTIRNYIYELEENGYITAFRRGKTLTNKYILHNTVKFKNKSDRKNTTIKEYTNNNIYNNSKNLQFKNLSHTVIDIFSQAFESINQIQINKLNSYNVSDLYLIKAIKKIALGGHNSTYFFNHLDILQEKGITTVEGLINEYKITNITNYKKTYKKSRKIERKTHKTSPTMEELYKKGYR